MSVATALQSMDYGVAPEASSTAEAWLKKHDGTFKLFIGGEWIATAKHFDCINPATGKKLGVIADGSAADVDAAVEAARAAQGAWPSSAATVARAIFTRWRASFRSMRACLPCWRRWTTASRSARPATSTFRWWRAHFYHHAGWAQLMESEFADHEPLGVVGQVIRGIFRC